MSWPVSVSWIRLCAEGQTADCISSSAVLYLAGLLAALVLLVIVAVRTRDLSTTVLALMPVAIAINIEMGSIISALRLPIYLDSVGTVLVGVLAGPWAGALTGLLSNLIWALLPVPGGAGPTVAFFAPVAAVIGLLAGFWASQGVFRLRAEDPRVGRFIAVAAGVGAALVALVVLQATVGLAFSMEDVASQNRFLLLSLPIAAVGVAVPVVSRRTVFSFRSDPARIPAYLAGATGVAAGVITFAVLRLLFAPTGYFSSVDGILPDGTADPFLGGASLTGLAITDPAGLLAVAAIAVGTGVVAWRWARRDEHARLFPVWIGGLTTGLVAALISAPIATAVFGGVTGGGTDALVALFRSLGLNVFQSALAQGLTSDPLDKTISYTVVFVILSALPMTVLTMFSHGEDAILE